MPERSQYTPGTPCWIDIGTDVGPAKEFYTSLFGWKTEDAGAPEETGGYGFFMKNGKMVAGFGPKQGEGPPFWSTYVCVSDADQTAKEVEAAGGTVVVPPMDVISAGRMAVFQDTGGAFISAWQPGDHLGAQLVNEDGSLTWNELNTRNVDAAKTFYRKAFGWDPVTHADGPMPYTEFQVSGQSIAGMMDMPPMVPAEVPSHWLVYFAVDDADAKVAKAQQLGASVLAPLMDVPVGRFSVLQDPQGAVFAVIRMSEPTS
jgi:predicted enzyme related to lactoylglutathione lyase